jgi:hypothetical protein
VFADIPHLLLAVVVVELLLLLLLQRVKFVAQAA